MLSPTTEHLSLPFEELGNLTGSRRIEAFLLTGLLLGAIDLLVYQKGGTQTVYPHLMYIPILFAAFYFKVTGGLATGIVAGLVLGPFMPLNVSAEIPQPTLNWVIRSGFFVMVGLVAGLGFEMLNAQLDRLRRRAYYDSLTMLPNLTALREYLYQLQIEGTQFRPSANRLLMIINVLNLTEIVNTLGYKRTDQFIRLLAQWLNQTLSQASMIARVESGKFAAVLIQEDFEASADLSTTLRDLRQIDLLMEEIPIHVETSIGIARFSDGGDEPDALIPMAEIAANRACTQGTSIAVYVHEQDSKRKENLQLLGELRKALITGDQLLLHYQPKLQLSTRRITGVEALIRWQHPGRGFIPPDQFIPLAESTALIEPITHWVLETALQQLSAWQHAGLDLEMALNLSARNLREQDFLSEMVKLLESHRVRPGQLTLEITESVLMDPTSETVLILAKLHERGIKIAIDDFGTGYSCLAYLQKLPIDSVKIDRSFIRHLQENSHDGVIVKTMIDFSHHFNLEIVAEGVESPEVLELLSGMGCNLAQGYHISRPLTGQEIEQHYIMK